MASLKGRVEKLEARHVQPDHQVTRIVLVPMRRIGEKVEEAPGPRVVWEWTETPSGKLWIQGYEHA